MTMKRAISIASFAGVFNLGNETSLIKGRFILAKDKVLRPMHAAAVRYASAVLMREAAQASDGESEA
jgi:hypothetical protein